MEVHVIRHTPVNFDKNRCYGRLDVSLADTFEEDVKKISHLLDDTYDSVYSSPLSRCTALAHALEVQNLKVDARLIELDFGTWEGKQWDELDQKVLNRWMMDFVKIAPPDGESLEAMFRRISDFMEMLRKEDFEKVLLITHSGVIRCLWAYLLEVPLKNVFKIPVGFHERFVIHLAKSRILDSIRKLK